MAKEWFTIEELRRAKGVNFDTEMLRKLGRNYQTMDKSQARVKHRIDARFYEVEFHISVIPEALRAPLQAFYGPGSICERISRLGIGLPVRQQQGVYVGFGDDVAIAAAEELFRRRRETTA